MPNKETPVNKVASSELLLDEFFRFISRIPISGALVLAPPTTCLCRQPCLVRNVSSQLAIFEASRPLPDRKPPVEFVDSGNKDHVV
jgi:hypothetical protein